MIKFKTSKGSKLGYYIKGEKINTNAFGRNFRLGMMFLSIGSIVVLPSLLLVQYLGHISITIHEEIKRVGSF
jgi:hypothetical protein